MTSILDRLFPLSQCDHDPDGHHGQPPQSWDAHYRQAYACREERAMDDEGEVVQ